MMDLEFTISAQEAGQALRVEIAADRATVTGLASGRKIVFEGVFGDVTVKLLPAREQDQPATAPVSPEIASAPAAAPQEQPAQQPTQATDSQLFSRLAALRKKISGEVKLPPFIIFHDSTLHEMCKALPADLEALGKVQGIGQAKLAKYGARFLEVIQEYIQERSV